MFAAELSYAPAARIRCSGIHDFNSRNMNLKWQIVKCKPLVPDPELTPLNPQLLRKRHCFFSDSSIQDLLPIEPGPHGINIFDRFAVQHEMEQ